METNFYLMVVCAVSILFIGWTLLFSERGKRIRNKIIPSREPKTHPDVSLQQELIVEPDKITNLQPSETVAAETSDPHRSDKSKDYAMVFLRKRKPVQKRQTYIGSELFTKITEILAVVASDVTVPTFLDNLLEDHLEQYRNEINALYSSKFKKPL